MITIETAFKTVRVRACAKLNLTLDIMGKRTDGYHDIDTVMQSVTLADIITVKSFAVSSADAAGKDSGSDNIIVRCSDASLDGEKNLGAAAAALFFEALPECKNSRKRYHTDIYIEKHIPVAAGLAGGSADAAAVLTALNLIYGSRFNEEKLCAIGLKAGADVPFCLMGGTLLALGVGEKLSQFPALPRCYIVILKSGEKASTGALYSRYDQECGNCEKAHSVTMQSALFSGSIDNVGRCLYNGFERLMEPELINIKAEMLNLGACGAALSGSGPSVFGLFGDSVKAHNCLESLKSRGEAFLCEPSSSGCEIISIS